MTISHRTGETDFSMGAPIWAIITLMIALFCGGCVASQCTTGESKSESVIYGVVLWGTMFSLLVWLMVSSINIGFVGVMGVANSNRLIPAPGRMDDTEQFWRANGMTDEGIRELRHDYPLAFSTGATSVSSQDLVPDSRTVSAAWWTFGGILLSMLAAISGALTGAGPTFTLVGFRTMLVPNHHHTGQARTAV